MDSWKEVVKVSQQLASQHPYMFWGMVGLVVITIFGWWLGDKHLAAAVSLIGAVFVIMSVIWLYNTNDIHEMLLAAVVAVVVVLVGIRIEIEHSFEQRLGSALKELQTQLSQQFEIRVSFQIENRLSELDNRLDAIHCQHDQLNAPILLDLEAKRQSAETSVPHLGSKGVDLIEEAAQELNEYLQKKRREAGL